MLINSQHRNLPKNPHDKVIYSFKVNDYYKQWQTKFDKRPRYKQVDQAFARLQHCSKIWDSVIKLFTGNTSSNLVRVTMIEVYLNKRLWMNSSEQSVSLAMRVHPFPSRTRQLSSSVLKILGWKRPGKIRRCRHTITALEHLKRLKCLNSSVGRARGC